MSSDDVKALIAEARDWSDWTKEGKLLHALADVLEAATVAPAVDREALARAIAGGDAIFYHPQGALAFMKADEIFASGILRDVRDVQAETLEGFAKRVGEWLPWNFGDMDDVLTAVVEDARASAQAIREARNER